MIPSIVTFAIALAVILIVLKILGKSVKWFPHIDWHVLRVVEQKWIQE